MKKSEEQIKRVISPHEMKALKNRDIVVKPNETMSLSYADKQHLELFCRVQIKDFGDLQELKYLPDKIDEKSLMNAIQKDDLEFFRISSGGLSTLNQEDCNCGHKKKINQPGWKRKQYNIHLAALLSDRYNQPFKWNDARIQKIFAIYNWYWRNKKFPFRLPVWITVKDIVVGENGVLNFPDCDGLNAANIKLHKDSSVNFGRGYVKINCTSLSGNL